MAAPIEPLEARQLMADIWGAGARLMRQDAAAILHPELTGAGQTVAVIDTGIDYNNPSLGGGIGPGFKVVAGKDFVDGDDFPMDTDGHGTEVAGVIAANQFTQGGFTYRGIAPDAKLIGLRISADTDAVPLDRIESALQWVVNNIDTYHITAVNLSFGFGRFSSSFAEPTIGDELQQLSNRGVAFVASAGNDGTQDGFGIDYPAADLTAFGVGSVNTSDVISEFSQRSDNLSLLAVGEGVHTTTLGTGFTTANGTSFAAPAVAATIALMKQVDSSFTLSDIRSMFRAALPTNYDGDQETGSTTGETFQRLDVLSSVNMALQRRAGSPPQQWMVGVDGSDSDIAFDRYGVLHFVYYDSQASHMMYATRSVNGAWSTASVIDDSGHRNLGLNLSMKLDSYGRPNVAYLDGQVGHLMFARLEGASWNIQTLDSSRITGNDPSLVIDSGDRAYVAYYRKTSGDLKLASRDSSGTWGRETLESNGNTGLTPVIALDNSQHLAIAYIDGGRDLLKLKRQDSDGDWSTQTLEHTVGDAAYVSMQFDAGNRPRMSYYETKTADLKYAAFDGDDWAITRIASKGATGLYTNLELDDDGLPTILYWDKRSNGLIKTAYNGKKWSGTVIATGSGKYLTAARSTMNGSWTYSCSQKASGGKLVLGEI